VGTKAAIGGIIRRVLGAFTARNHSIGRITEEKKSKNRNALNSIAIVA
jgi:hypothetical protein